MTDELRQMATRAMIVLTNDGEQRLGGRGVLFVLHETGWHPAIMAVATKRPFVWLVDAGYRVVADHRQLFSRLIFRHHPTDGPFC